MSTENEDKIGEIQSTLANNENLQKQARPGRCRFWADNALDLLDGFRNDTVTIEARETSGRGEHTFIQVTINGEEFIIDGTGYGGNGPYSGPAGEAPEILQQSTPDIINSYRKLLGKDK